jgi:prevent-host-death family protein
MTQVNIHEAKTNLSMLLSKTAKGEEFIIAKAGKPIAKVVPFSTAQKKLRRGGFLINHAVIPDDFDTMGGDEIAAMFEAPQ